jgi:hypothetical protein
VIDRALRYLNRNYSLLNLSFAISKPQDNLAWPASADGKTSRTVIHLTPRLAQGCYTLGRRTPRGACHGRGSDRPSRGTL